MFDLVIRGGEVVDGTGAPRRRADVGVVDRRIVAVGDLDESGRRTIDAGGLVVAPGFIDVHTHLDVQAFWDPMLTPSSLHGITTVVGGNCGFTIAPLASEHADYLQRMLARVEGMPLPAVQRGTTWDWRTTGEFLDRLEGRLGINAGFMVGHSTMRRLVMGEASLERAATEDEIGRMELLLRAGLAAGGLGFSSTSASSHVDGDGNPVPSRQAAPEELLRLAAVCREYPGTSLEYLPFAGAAAAFPDEAMELMARMSVAAQRPLNWNLVFVQADNADEIAQKLSASDLARARGGKVVALHMPKPLEARVSFDSGNVLHQLPGWHETMMLPTADKLARLREPSVRSALADGARRGSARIGTWSGYVVEQTVAADNRRYEGRSAGEIAAQEGKEAFDVVLDVACADELATIFRLPLTPDSPDLWRARADLFDDPRTLIGASDAGAHLDALGTFDYPTALLALGVRQHRVVTLERAVHLITQAPARLYGLLNRGVITEGAIADLVLFDEATVGTEPLHVRRDLPGGAGRLYAASTGIEQLIVGGAPVITDGEFTDARPGAVLRSGTDTTTPHLA